MLKIKALKININTNKGLYGTPLLTFEDGLNIIRGNNSAGKSTIFQSILYCLGLEELIGGKNEKTMQSVLKTEILNNNKVVDANGNETYEIESLVTESHVLLEISGSRTVTIRRYITSQTKKTGLVEVFDGAMLTVPGQYDYHPMYVHDPGSSKEDNPFGFHPFLESILGWNLPEVQYKDGNFKKLYIQNIFPAFVIEQKAGWTDFLASIPFYSLNDKETRAIEFLLNLDSANIQRRKTEIRQEKNNLENEWSRLYLDFKGLAKSIACEIKGVDQQPNILLTQDSLYLTFSTSEETVLLKEYVQRLLSEYEALLKLEVPTIGEVAVEKERELNALNEKANNLTINLNALLQHKRTEQERFKSYNERKAELENDLNQNKYHKKVKEKGAENGLMVAHDVCPYCEQHLNDSLLPKEIDQIPMQIEENISFLESQINLINIYIKNHHSEKEILDSKINAHTQEISDTRSQIRSLKTQLTSDNRLPSIDIIEKRLRLKNRLDLYSNKLNEVPSYQERFFKLSQKWAEILSKESNLTKSLSERDESKLRDLQYIFKGLLSHFNYRSKALKDIHISKESFLPVVDKYSLKFDSSASDFIRAIWSYTLSLRDVSIKYNGNHPNFFMLDEPGTQETANEDLRNLFSKLENSTGAQSLVFCSFKQSESTFQESTTGVDFHLINLGTGKYIRSLKE